MSDIRTFIIKTAPTSVNSQKTMGRIKGKPRIIKSKEYRVWEQIATLELRTQEGFDVKHPFLWSSSVKFPANHSNMDIDNALKSLHDILVTLGKVPDDRYLVSTSIAWADTDCFEITVKREPLQIWSAIKRFAFKTAAKLALGYPP